MSAFLHLLSGLMVGTGFTFGLKMYVNPSLNPVTDGLMGIILILFGIHLIVLAKGSYSRIR